MRNVKAALMPMVVLLVLVVIAFYDPVIPQIAYFAFAWDILLGCLLGGAMACLPSMAGFGGKRNGLTTMMWVGGFAAMLLIFYQCLSMATGIRLDALSFLTHPGTRMRIVEGAMLSFCSFVAGRGRI